MEQTKQFDPSWYSSFQSDLNLHKSTDVLEKKNFVFHILHDTITARLCVNNANLGELVHH